MSSRAMPDWCRRSGSVTVSMAAPAEVVWSLVADVTRIGEWSPECRRADWLDGAAGPGIGVRFRGHNRWKLNRWSRVCEVVEAEPGRVFGRSTSTVGYRHVGALLGPGMWRCASAT